MSLPLKDLQRYGQSIWYDNIKRDMLASGELRRLLDQGVLGITSNPTISRKRYRAAPTMTMPCAT